ncbi:hypothetical protein K8R62_03940 [bacterium]|nr:hypothetical protein [bacterium]
MIKKNGPVLPVQISKHIDSNIIFAGAILSELVKTKQVLISSAKIGGSPVYYMEGQENKLDTLYSHLKDVHKQVYDLLKQKKVLQDTQLEAWQRVALREIKDFAIMLKTNTGEIFWKWYLLSNQDIEHLIKEILKIPAKKEIPIKPKIEKKEPLKEKIEEQQPVLKEKQVILKEKEITSGDYTEFFEENNLQILKEKTIRKNKNMDFIALVPSKIGDVKFFIKFKDKKKVSDEDLKLAYYESKEKNLPLLFLMTGELTKKGQEYLKNKDIQIKTLKEKP